MWKCSELSTSILITSSTCSTSKFKQLARPLVVKPEVRFGLSILRQWGFVLDLGRKPDSLCCGRVTGGHREGTGVIMTCMPGQSSLMKPPPAGRGYSRGYIDRFGPFSLGTIRGPRGAPLDCLLQYSCCCVADTPQHFLTVFWCGVIYVLRCASTQLYI